jgi:hypothetical protein
MSSASPTSSTDGKIIPHAIVTTATEQIDRLNRILERAHLSPLMSVDQTLTVLRMEDRVDPVAVQKALRDAGVPATHVPQLLIPLGHDVHAAEGLGLPEPAGGEIIPHDPEDVPLPGPFHGEIIPHPPGTGTGP